MSRIQDGMKTDFDVVVIGAGFGGMYMLYRLRKQGFTIVARNYRLAAGDGEADLIAWEKETLVFVEVKSRKSDQHGPPERAIDERKRQHLKRIAREYTRKTETPWEHVRFDLVPVVFSDPPRIELLRGALTP